MEAFLRLSAWLLGERFVGRESFRFAAAAVAVPLPFVGKESSFPFAGGRAWVAALSGAVSRVGDGESDAWREASFLVFLKPSLWMDQCSSLGVTGGRRCSRWVLT